jgi:hypothetical protein
MFKTLQATVNNFDMDELFSADPWTRKKNEQVKIEFDLLVLSAALYRLRKVASKDTSMNHIHTMSLTDTQLPKYVTPEDYDFAETIKEHFGQKLFVLKLKNTNLTNFREDLNSFLHSSWHTDTSGVFIYPERFLGLAYKLPYLYEYDMQMKEVFDSDYCDIKGPNALRDEKSLTHNNNTEYWFSDEKNNRVMIVVEKHNPLKSVFDYLVQEPVKVKGKFEMRMKDSQQYYSTPVWEVVI